MEIANRIMKYNNHVRFMYPLLKDKSINRKCKLIIYNTILKPIIMYGSECWSLTTRNESKIQAAEMRVLRTVKGVTRRHRIRSTAIRAELEVETLLDTIEKKRLQWYRYSMRMSDRRYPKKAFLWTPEWKRPIGRPRKDGSKEDNGQWYGGEQHYMMWMQKDCMMIGWGGDNSYVKTKYIHQYPYGLPYTINIIRYNRTSNSPAGPKGIDGKSREGR